ncbi:hypothetical protein J5X98_13490 [Leptothermofonsia sichuanensis E412]|uniref:hypothetical protein n=1 Tax=Leptothermofonsia sichuanensis TaxID=2917832 RepID=UPI001CA623A6|nr:hypothetical protein [Leptothermofonsia sichuanensis]QZZ23255.1 hypothetical protein J5X98_13490 [Leptothermofonsia sichuanensis E412]
MSADLFKNALFLWDKIEYVVPDKEFKPEYEDDELAEAVRFFAKKYVPSQFGNYWWWRTWQI